MFYWLMKGLPAFPTGGSTRYFSLVCVCVSEKKKSYLAQRFRSRIKNYEVFSVFFFVQT